MLSLSSKKIFIAVAATAGCVSGLKVTLVSRIKKAKFEEVFLGLKRFMKMADFKQPGQVVCGESQKLRKQLYNKQCEVVVDIAYEAYVQESQTQGDGWGELIKQQNVYFTIHKEKYIQEFSKQLKYGDTNFKFCPEVPLTRKNDKQVEPKTRQNRDRKAKVMLALYQLAKMIGSKNHGNKENISLTREIIQFIKKIETAYNIAVNDKVEELNTYFNKLYCKKYQKKLTGGLKTYQTRDEQRGRIENILLENEYLVAGDGRSDRTDCQFQAYLQIELNKIVTHLQTEGELKIVDGTKLKKIYKFLKQYQYQYDDDEQEIKEDEKPMQIADDEAELYGQDPEAIIEIILKQIQSRKTDKVTARIEYFLDKVKNFTQKNALKCPTPYQQGLQLEKLVQDLTKLYEFKFASVFPLQVAGDSSENFTQMWFCRKFACDSPEFCKRVEDITKKKMKVEWFNSVFPENYNVIVDGRQQEVRDEIQQQEKQEREQRWLEMAHSKKPQQQIEQQPADEHRLKILEQDDDVQRYLRNYQVDSVEEFMQQIRANPKDPLNKFISGIVINGLIYGRDYTSASPADLKKFKELEVLVKEEKMGGSLKGFKQELYNIMQWWYSLYKLTCHCSTCNGGGIGIQHYPVYKEVGKEFSPSGKVGILLSALKYWEFNPHEYYKPDGQDFITQKSKYSTLMKKYDLPNQENIFVRINANQDEFLKDRKNHQSQQFMTQLKAKIVYGRPEEKEQIEAKKQFWKSFMIPHIWVFESVKASMYNDSSDSMSGILGVEDIINTIEKVEAQYNIMRKNQQQQEPDYQRSSGQSTDQTVDALGGGPDEKRDSQPVIRSSQPVTMIRVSCEPKPVRLHSVCLPCEPDCDEIYRRLMQIHPEIGEEFLIMDGNSQQDFLRPEMQMVDDDFLLTLSDQSSTLSDQSLSDQSAIKDQLLKPEMADNESSETLSEGSSSDVNNIVAIKREDMIQVAQLSNDTPLTVSRESEKPTSSSSSLKKLSLTCYNCHQPVMPGYISSHNCLT